MAATTRRGIMRSRIVWFVVLWLLGVAITGVVAFVIRAVLGVSG